MFCLIVGTLYRGDLAAKLIAPKLNIPFKDIEGLVVQTKLAVHVTDGSYLHFFGKVASNSLINIDRRYLRTQIRLDKKCYVSTGIFAHISLFRLTLVSDCTKGDAVPPPRGQGRNVS